MNIFCNFVFHYNSKIMFKTRKEIILGSIIVGGILAFFGYKWYTGKKLLSGNKEKDSRKILIQRAD